MEEKAPTLIMCDTRISIHHSDNTAQAGFAFLKCLNTLSAMTAVGVGLMVCWNQLQRLRSLRTRTQFFLSRTLAATSAEEVNVSHQISNYMNQDIKCE